MFYKLFHFQTFEGNLLSSCSVSGILVAPPSVPPILKNTKRKSEIKIINTPVCGVNQIWNNISPSLCYRNCTIERAGRALGSSFLWVGFALLRLPLQRKTSEYLKLATSKVLRINFYASRTFCSRVREVPLQVQVTYRCTTRSEEKFRGETFSAPFKCSSRSTWNILIQQSHRQFDRQVRLISETSHLWTRWPMRLLVTIFCVTPKAVPIARSVKSFSYRGVWVLQFINSANSPPINQFLHNVPDNLESVRVHTKSIYSQEQGFFHGNFWLQICFNFTFCFFSFLTRQLSSWHTLFFLSEPWFYFLRSDSQPAHPQQSFLPCEV